MSTGDFPYREILDNLNEGIYFVDPDRRITYWNAGAENITGYPASEVVGKYCRNDILEHVDSEGRPLCGTDRCPAIRAMKGQESFEAQVFFKHSDGHRVPALMHAAPIHGPAGKVIGAVESFYDNSSTIAAREEMEQLRKLALLDPLTELGNRRHAEQHMRERLGELQRYGWQFGVLMIDIDHFKRINDEYGHDVGDQVLKAVARTTQNSLRSLDTVSRWGGEEFLALIAHADIDRVERIAERLRRMVESLKLPWDPEPINPTVSIGGTIANEEDDADQLVKRADENMYACKRGGRNRILVIP